MGKTKLHFMCALKFHAWMVRSALKTILIFRRYKDTLQVVFNLKDTTNITHTAARWEIRRRIARFVIHPQYNSRTQHEDIALIEFKEPIDYLRRDKNLAPICLPENSRQTFEMQNATFTGFGHTSYGSNSPGPKGIKL